MSFCHLQQKERESSIALFGKEVGVSFVTTHNHFPEKSISKYSNFFTFYYYSNKKVTTKQNIFIFSYHFFTFSYETFFIHFFFFSLQSISTIISKPKPLLNTPMMFGLCIDCLLFQICSLCWRIAMWTYPTLLKC
jgi:hypothetical protein